MENGMKHQKMIFKDRNKVDKPTFLETKRAQLAFDKMHTFFIEQSETSKKRRFKFDPSIYNHRDVRHALNLLFHGKCAYCESRIVEISKPDVELFRPKAGSMSLDGSYDPDHYWWLAYEWENLYQACAICNRQYKRNYFPVEGNQRAQIMGDLSAEEPMLVDPCNEDDFLFQHITFENEVAVPRSEKGEITIKTIGLNRNELKKSRIRELSNFRVIMDHLMEGGTEYFEDNYKQIKGIIDRAYNPETPYLACIWANYGRQLLAYGEDSAPDFIHLDEPVQKMESQEELEMSTPMEQVYEKKAARKSYSLDKMTETAKEGYFGESRWITKVRIKNFKVIEDLELKFSDLTPGRGGQFKQPWLTMLGENGTGKSTVLQAIALTLIGEERLNGLGLNARKFVNHNNDDNEGSVRVFLSDRTKPITLRFSKSSSDFEVTPKAPQIIVRAYGATRLFSDNPDDEVESDFLFIDNLFDPLNLLVDGNRWLLEKISDEKLFPEIEKSLGELLSLEEGQYFSQDIDEDGKPIVSLQLYPGRKPVALDDLSAGYKAVLALGLDIMMGFGQIWPSIFNAQGVVLVDEIGVHLHPRWKMRIVDALRRTFPNINFVIATHEPLCLRGLEDGEVIMMRLDGNKDIEIIRDLPSHKNMRVGQLLTSVFGLHTTMDPELEKLYSEYYQLIALHDRTEDQELHLEELKMLLEDHMEEDPLTGKTRLNSMLGRDIHEMLEFQVIEQKVAEFKTGEKMSSLKNLKEETLQEVQNLWKKKL